MFLLVTLDTIDGDIFIWIFRGKFLGTDDKPAVHFVVDHIQGASKKK